MKVTVEDSYFEFAAKQSKRLPGHLLSYRLTHSHSLRRTRVGLLNYSAITAIFTSHNVTLGKTHSFNFYLITKVFNDVIFFYSETDALKHHRPIRNSNTQQLSYLSYGMSAAAYKPGTGTVPTRGQSRPSL